MMTRLSIAIASCLILAAPVFSARAETTGEAPAPEATNPAPSDETNQTERQKAMPPGKDTGPQTQAPSGSSDGDSKRTGAERQGDRGSGASATTPPDSATTGKPAR